MIVILLTPLLLCLGVYACTAAHVYTAVHALSH
jgi:hypothetical protein